MPRVWAVPGGRVSPEEISESVAAWLRRPVERGSSASYLQEGRCAAIFLLEDGEAKPGASVLVVEKRAPGYDAHREFDLLRDCRKRRPRDFVEPLAKCRVGRLAAYTARFYPEAAECNLHCAALGSSFACVGYRVMAGGGARPLWDWPGPAYFSRADQSLVAREAARLLAGTFDARRGRAARLRSDAFFSGDLLFVREPGGAFSLRLAALRETERTDLDGFIDAMVRLRAQEGPMPPVWPFLTDEAFAEGVAAALGASVLPRVARALRRRGRRLSPTGLRAVAAASKRRTVRLSQALAPAPSLETGFWRAL